MTLTLRYAVRSDRGLVRGNNEDAVYAGPRLLAIADGMGGHAAGEVASKLVIGSLERLDEDRPLGDMLYALRNAVEEANHDLAGATSSKGWARLSPPCVSPGARSGSCTSGIRGRTYFATAT